MLILLLVIFIAAFVLGTLFINNWESRMTVQVISGICTTVTFIALIMVTIELTATFTVNEKIEMYTEENKNIENQIELIVANFG